MRSVKHAILLGMLCAVAGCARAPGMREGSPRGALAELPHDCDAVLAEAAALSIGVIESTGEYLVESDQGSCVTDEDSLVDGLNKHREPRVASRVIGAISRIKADPSPHPDLGAGVVSADPSPHPDLDDTVSADPTPHPDLNGDDTESVEVVVWVVFVNEDGATESAEERTGTTTPAGQPSPMPSASSQGAKNSTQS